MSTEELCDWHGLPQAAEEIARLKRELEISRAGNVKLINALDRSCQLIEAYLAWLPEGQVMSPGLATAKEAWSQAMTELRK
jgi:hypothetical protein